MKNYILSKKDEKEEEDLKILDYNLYDDNIVYSNNI